MTEILPNENDNASRVTCFNDHVADVFSFEINRRISPTRRETHTIVADKREQEEASSPVSDINENGKMCEASSLCGPYPKWSQLVDPGHSQKTTESATFCPASWKGEVLGKCPRSLRLFRSDFHRMRMSDKPRRPRTMFSSSTSNKDTFLVAINDRDEFQIVCFVVVVTWNVFFC